MPNESTNLSPTDMAWPMDQQFIRDRLTWLGYLLFFAVCFIMPAMAALMPFMRSELHLNYITSAYHFSAWAVGGLLAGTIGDRVMIKLGGPATIWSGGAGVILGTLTLLSASNPCFTIFGIGIAGMSASLIGQTVSTIMSNRFGEQRSVGITEANIAASASSSMAPTVVACCIAMGWSWRAALTFPVFALILLGLNFRNDLAKAPEIVVCHQSVGNLPPVYWAYWIVIVFSVACEWSMIFWCADFLEHVAMLSRANASEAVTVFLAAMMTGRIIGSRLVQRVSINVLLPGTAAIAIAGFLFFWLSRSVTLNIAGLFIAGLGIANLYPLTLSQAIAVIPEHANTASARASIGTGTAAICAPLLLGMVAERSSIFVAYGIVALLLGTVAAMVVLSNRSAQRHARALSKANVPQSNAIR